MAVADPDLKYDFMPWARRGLARAHTHASLTLDGVSALPLVSMGLKLKGSGGTDATSTPTIDLKVLGPGDVIGIDPRVIVRVEPRTNNHDFEPNYLAAIEFDTPDFPWLFTPAKADANDRLAPWIALVVFARDEVADPVLRPGRVLPSTLLPTNAPLPNLAESWMWAHAQVVRDAPTQQVIDMLQNAPAKNLSRLVCPRRLQPNKSYIACLVPTFKPGLDAALGRPVAADATLSPAWAGTQAQTDFELPCYYHWTFSTGPAGDFETLARRLKAPAEYPPGIQDKLDKLGRLPVEVDADYLLQPHDARQNPDPDYVRDNYLAQYEGALLSLAIADSPEPGADDAIADDLASVLNAPEASSQGMLDLDAPTLQIPVVGPPIYGGFHARRHSIDTDERDRWLDHLNASVPRRMAAGVGTRLVQVNQETFMRAAWQQVGDVLRAERLFSLSHLAKKALTLLTQRFSILPEARRLTIFAPASTRIRIDEKFTVYGYAHSTSLPDGFVDGALRRTLSPARALLRRTVGSANAAAAHLVELAAGFQTKAAAASFADPARFRSDGFATLEALGNAKPGKVAIDVPGLGSGLDQRTLRALRRSGTVAQRQLKQDGWRDASISDRLKAGVLTDSHFQRLGELNAALADSGATSAVGMRQLAGELGASKPMKAEGILLNVQGGVDTPAAVSVQGLKVDARGGQLLDVAPKTTLRGGRVGATVYPGTIGLVEVDAIRRYGNNALFNSLPANSVPSTAETPISITSTGGADFTASSTPAAGQVSITVAPPLSTALELDRFKQAWRGKLSLNDVAKPPKGVTLDIVPFKTVATTKSAAQAVNPQLLVTRRVESLLQLGSADFGLAKAPAGVFGEVLKDKERFIIPKLYDRVMAYPKIDEALYRRLVQMDKSAFMPGVEDIPNDTILLVKTNPAFVESFMVGTNHEMGRELLWRGYPTDQRGTPFQRFWQYFDPNKVDIQPIHKWNAWDDLGEAGSPIPGDNGEGRLALLIRGQLLRRYPNTAIYAVRKDAGASEPDFTTASKFVSPEGAGTIGNDIVFFLFPILASDANKHWFVLEEPMTEPRFGFDDQELTREVRRVRRRGGKVVQVGPSAPVGAMYLAKVNQQLALQNLPPVEAAGAGDTWLDVDWGEVGTPVGGHITLNQLKQVDLMDNGLEVVGGSHAGEVARAMLQRPFRGYFDGSRLS